MYISRRIGSNSNWVGLSRQRCSLKGSHLLDGPAKRSCRIEEKMVVLIAWERGMSCVPSMLIAIDNKPGLRDSTEAK
jgi:hypothetical protein